MSKKNLIMGAISLLFLSSILANFSKAEALEEREPVTVELLKNVASIKTHFPGMEFIPCDIAGVHFNEEVCAMQYQVALEIIEKNHKQKPKSATLKVQKFHPTLKSQDLQELPNKVLEPENNVAQLEKKITNLSNTLRLIAALAIVAGISLILALLFAWTNRRQKKKES